MSGTRPTCELTWKGFSKESCQNRVPLTRFLTRSGGLACKKGPAQQTMGGLTAKGPAPVADSPEGVQLTQSKKVFHLYRGADTPPEVLNLTSSRPRSRTGCRRVIAPAALIPCNDAWDAVKTTVNQKAFSYTVFA